MPTDSNVAVDLKGHYEALRLRLGAGPESVQHAYDSLLEEWRQCPTFSRFPVQEAYRVLSDPEKKADYDALCRGEEEEEVSTKLRSIVLSAILTILLLQVSFVFPGFLLPGPDWFHYGDVIVRSHDQAGLGEVIRREAAHRFPRGQVADAYLMGLKDGTERWYPARDLEMHYVCIKAGRLQ